MKILRWIETQGRHLDEIHRSNDTGLCNRIFYWEALQLINKLNNYKFTIEVDEDFWPELKEMIQLPNTVTTNQEFHNSNLEYKDISSNDIKNIFEKEILNLEKDKYFSDFKYGDMSMLDRMYENDRPITTITLKDKELDTLIKDFSKNKIGIHIRRGRGVIYGEQELESLPKNIRILYENFRKLEGEFTYKFYDYSFINDEVYFYIIDEVLKINPYQEFYISHDLPDNLINYYKVKYPNNIFTKDYFYQYIQDKYETSDTHVKNIIDLFCISNTKFVLRQPLSTWSQFAHYYTKKHAQVVTDDISHILYNIKKVL
jgi:hypothetical protein